MRLWHLEKEYEELILAIERRRQEQRGEIDRELRQIKKDVIEGGSTKIVELSRKFDRWEENLPLRVSSEEIQNAIARVEKADIDAIKRMIKKVRDYHRLQKRKGFLYRDKGLTIKETFVPLERALVYVPSGRAPYFSSLIMGATPALIAGVKEVIVTTPAKGGRVHDIILATCFLLGIEDVYRIGGAQAIYAFAYGVGVPKVDIIVGPGNIYVEEAKRDVFGVVGIDMPAGPTELIVLMTKKIEPEIVLWDLFSQAEHDEMAQVGVFCRDKTFLVELIEKVEILVKTCERKETIEKALRDNSFFVYFEDLAMAIEAINRIAPEHLEILSDERIDNKILYPGIVYIGPFAHTSLGDYYTGTNHILPTKGAGRFLGALSVDNFTRRKVTVSVKKKFDPKGVERLPLLEGFFAHAKAIEVRRHLK